MPAPSSLLSGIMNPAQADVLGALDKGKERQATDMAGEILGQTIGGKIGELARLSPDKAIAYAKATNTPIDSMGRIKNLMGINVMGAKLLQAGQLQEAAQFLGEEADKIESLTGEPASNLRLAQNAILNGDQEVMGNFMKAGIALDPSAKRPEYAQSTVKGMEGWVFDKTSGTYAIDPKFEEFLASDAAKLSSKEFLDIKDIKGVNDKVTDLTKNPMMIYGAARDLAVLEEGGTVTDQIAAVFKFMKAMDPTSTVRESELGLVYGAEGAAQGFANSINNLLGGGKINDTNFKSIVDTAKKLANVSIDTGGVALDGYLGVIQDNMTPNQYNKMRERMPTKFNLTTKVDF